MDNNALFNHAMKRLWGFSCWDNMKKSNEYVRANSKYELNENKTKKLNKQGAIWIDETYAETEMCTIFVNTPEKEFDLTFINRYSFIGLDAYRGVPQKDPIEIELLIFLLKEIYQDKRIRLRLLSKPIHTTSCFKETLAEATKQLHEEGIRLLIKP